MNGLTEIPCHMKIPHDTHTWDIEDKVTLQYQCPGRGFEPGDPVRHRRVGDKGTVVRVDHFQDGERPDGLTEVVVVRYNRFGFGFESPEAFEYLYEVPKTDEQVLKNECPKCGAPSGVKCVTATGGETETHAGRKSLGNL